MISRYNTGMSLSIGIVGLPNVGKSTLFNALLKKQQALAANYPFATIEPNVGIVPVPDGRLAELSALVGNAPIVPATIMFTDIAGIVKGASQGEGLGNKFLSHIREADAVCMVVRAFEDEDVVLTGSGDPADDREVLMTELILADMQTVEKQAAPKGTITPALKKRWSVIEQITLALDAGSRADSVPLDDESRELVRDLCLMTLKPIIYVVNVDEAELSAQVSLAEIYAGKLGVDRDSVVIVSAKIEAELSEMDEAEQREYLESLGLLESGLERLIKVGYTVLGLQSYLTAGEKEVRAWTIRSGMSAVQAAGVIHTDFMKKFIKAEIVGFSDFVSLGGWKQAREAGKARQEGRDYVMREGDVVEFRIGT
jgi:ribosome-binding ATPase